MSITTWRSKRIAPLPRSTRSARTEAARAELEREAAGLSGAWVLVAIEREAAGHRGRADGSDYTELFLVGASSIDAIGAELEREAQDNCLEMLLLARSKDVDPHRLGF